MDDTPSNLTDDFQEKDDFCHTYAEYTRTNEKCHSPYADQTLNDKNLKYLFPFIKKTEQNSDM